MREKPIILIPNKKNNIGIINVVIPNPCLINKLEMYAPNPPI